MIANRDPEHRADPRLPSSGMIKLFAGSLHSSRRRPQLHLHCPGERSERVPFVLGSLRPARVVAHATVHRRDRTISSRSVSSHASPHSSRVACCPSGHEPNRYHLMDESAVNEHPSNKEHVCPHPSSVVRQLKAERDRLAKQLSGMDAALRGFAGVYRMPRRARRVMSLAARKKIAAAQRRRWANLKAARK